MIRRLNTVQQALDSIQSGHIIAYPTEAVYGLGCDPFNLDVVDKLLALKGRPHSKGLIVLIAHWSQLFPLIGDIPLSRLDAVQSTWPGPTTWVFPKSSQIPAWLSGERDTLAIRMTAHPLAKALCELGPIVSTSANRQSEMPARTIQELDRVFPVGLDGVLTGDLGSESQTSAIYDVLTGQRLR